jgi:hypothetical protein
VCVALPMTAPVLSHASISKSIFFPLTFTQTY